jgi:hypothetical protein
MLLPHSKGRLCALTYLLAGALLSPSFLSAQSITVASGTLLSLGAGSIDAGCGDLSVAGTFSVGSGSANSLRNVVINPGTIKGVAEASTCRVTGSTRVPLMPKPAASTLPMAAAQLFRELPATARSTDSVRPLPRASNWSLPQGRPKLSLAGCP